MDLGEEPTPPLYWTSIILNYILYLSLDPQTSVVLTLNKENSRRQTGAIIGNHSQSKCRVVEPSSNAYISKINTTLTIHSENSVEEETRKLWEQEEQKFWCENVFSNSRKRGRKCESVGPALSLTLGCGSPYWKPGEPGSDLGISPQLQTSMEETHIRPPWMVILLLYVFFKPSLKSIQYETD